MHCGLCYSGHFSYKIKMHPFWKTGKIGIERGHDGNECAIESYATNGGRGLV